MDKKDTFGNKLGKFVANVVVACLAVCLSACFVALTLRFITWLF
jgi:hypothetical protein